MSLRLAAWATLTALALGSKSSTGHKPVEVVLPRCHEDISWLQDLGYGSLSTIYEKCGASEGLGQHVTQENVGRESGTYLRHIVERYDSLADWTVFTPPERPLYGYHGHRLGGGHMMNNVRFENYVEAAATKAQRPLFFVFSTVLLESGSDLHQSFRRGFGQEYDPSAEAAVMCGSPEDWDTFVQLPSWFKDMVARLQKQQNSPLEEFDFEATLKLFDVAPTEGVVYFAQGARFAASREAILQRPKSYYENLLTLMTHADPWAGYYLEWLWWYVVGGQSAPCGYEAILADSHTARLGENRLEIAQALNGSITTGFMFSGTTTETSLLTLALSNASAEIVFQAGSVTTLNAGCTFTGGARVIAEAGAQIFINGASSIEMNATFTSSTFDVATGVTCAFTTGTTEFVECDVDLKESTQLTFSGAAAWFSGATFVGAGTVATLPVVNVATSTELKFLSGFNNTVSTPLSFTGGASLTCEANAGLIVNADVDIQMNTLFYGMLSVAELKTFACSGDIDFENCDVDLFDDCLIDLKGKKAKMKGVKLYQRGLETVTREIRLSADTALTLPSGFTNVFAAPLDFTGGGSFTCEAGSTLDVDVDVIMGVIASGAAGASFSLSAGFNLTGSSATFEGCIFDVLSGGGLNLLSVSASLKGSTLNVNSGGSIVIGTANINLEGIILNLAGGASFFSEFDFTWPSLSQTFGTVGSTVTQIIGVDAVVTFQMNSVLTFLSKARFSGFGTLMIKAGSMLSISTSLEFASKASIISTTFTMAANAILKFSNAIGFSNITIGLIEGCTVEFTGATITFDNTAATATLAAVSKLTGIGKLMASASASLTFLEEVQFMGQVDFADTTLVHATAFPLTFSGYDVSFASVTVTGGGTATFEYTAAATVAPILTFSTSTMALNMKIKGKANSAKSNFVKVKVSGTQQSGGLDLDATSALELQLGGTVTGSSYSNSIEALTYAAGSVVMVTGVTTSAKATLISSLQSPVDLALEVDASTLGAVSATVSLIEYAASSCSNPQSATVTGCASGFSCTVSTRSKSSNLCAIELNSSTGTTSSSNNMALLGLLALLVIPIVIVIALVVAYFTGALGGIFGGGEAATAIAFEGYGQGAFNPSGLYPSPAGNYF